MDVEAVAKGLKRGDMKLVERVLATNGGGVWYDLIPAAQLARLERLGMLQSKKVTQRNPLVPVVHGMVVHGPNALAVRAHLQGEGK